MCFPYVRSGCAHLRVHTQMAGCTHGAQSVNIQHTHDALCMHTHADAAQRHPVQPTESALARHTVPDTGWTVLATHGSGGPHKERATCRPNVTSANGIHLFYSGLYTEHLTLL